MNSRNPRRRHHGSRLGLALAALVTLSATGCYKATFVQQPSAVDSQPHYTRWSHHYLLGMVGHGDHDAGELCPDGIAAVRTAGDFTTGVVTIATLGIYAPRRVHVTCSDPRTASSLEVSR